MLIGIHASAAGGMGACAARVSAMGIRAAQVFTANPRRHSTAPLPESDVEAFRKLSEGVVWLSHCSYLINPASGKQDTSAGSRAALKAEFDRCIRLGICCCVLHPGSAPGPDRAEGVRRAAGMIRSLLEDMPEGPVLLLENTSGAGGNLCGDLDELRGILDMADVPGRAGACLDTAHAHGYGYTLDTPEHALEFCRMAADLFAGFPTAFHLNDSGAERGSRSDRHQSPGLGAVGVASLAAVQSFEGFAGSPGVLETPGEDSDRLNDLRRILEFPQH